MPSWSLSALFEALVAPRPETGAPDWLVPAPPVTLVRVVGVPPPVPVRAAGARELAGRPAGGGATLVPPATGTTIPGVAPGVPAGDFEAGEVLVSTVGRSVTLVVSGCPGADGHCVQPRSGAVSAPTPRTPATRPAATVPAKRRSRTSKWRLAPLPSSRGWIIDMPVAPSRHSFGKFYGEH